MKLGGCGASKKRHGRSPWYKIAALFSEGRNSANPLIIGLKLVPVMTVPITDLQEFSPIKDQEIHFFPDSLQIITPPRS
jgi:hypothetical protein